MSEEPPFGGFFDSEGLPIFSTGLYEPKIERSISKEDNFRIFLLLNRRERKGRVTKTYKLNINTTTLIITQGRFHHAKAL
ncbi:hypothetical protein JQC72_00480 [Polycladomyces sp. WAk]|uniref:LAGLIDADG endonuclease n=1 Tax=Polycladomyces zharkentensis TaxID=2807616 RepID=A0ABS2WEN2_9BACL|nr:hypothetical protein [Polycladomyces sp. WAk]MBN2907997.1 hypothetical protein [Polycladomyces sp. WAk]